MNYEEIEKQFHEIDFDYNKYVPLALNDKTVRDKLINNIVGDYHINLYYRSYYIVNDASKQRPELFYEYWDDLVPLLEHKNSYHRNIAHWLLTNLVIVDSKNKFDSIKDKYFSLIDDEKFLTGAEALKDIIIVSKIRKDLKDEITNYILNEKLYSNYKENQITRFKYLILEYLESIEIKDSNSNVIEFLNNCLESENKRNKKKAQQILHKINK